MDCAPFSASAFRTRGGVGGRPGEPGGGLPLGYLRGRAEPDDSAPPMLGVCVPQSTAASS